MKRYVFFLALILWGSYCVAGTATSPDSLNNAVSNDSTNAVEIDTAATQSLPDSVASATEKTAEISEMQAQSILQTEPEEGSVKLSWQTGILHSCERLFLERSEDNRVFTVITEFPAQWLHREFISFVDGTVRDGATYYYRLVSRDSGGKITRYSPVKIAVRIRQPSAGPVQAEQ